uniref:CAP-Gly domain-containing protein n=1 Tax=Plectus sambesii TaxID=2011161 RepID=A0A914WRK8_9BILA
MAVNISITSSTLPFPSEKHFPASTTLMELKKKLELIVGASCDTMMLELRDKDNAFVAALNDDTATLESAGVRDGMVLHVIDTGNNSLLATDDSMVEKFELPDDVYEKRTDSVRAWKQREGLGRFNASAQGANKEKEQQIIEESEKVAANLKIGQRCQTKLANQPEKRGKIAFVGKTHFKPGVWVGVHYDEPLGRNDGTVDGQRYFECPDKYGGFVRPQDVQVGDFPELSIDDEMDEI